MRHMHSERVIEHAELVVQEAESKDPDQLVLTVIHVLLIEFR